MKRLILSLLVLAGGNAAGQLAPTFEDAGVPFGAPAGGIAWSAPTNQLPKALWIYKTIPQRFPDQVISNLVALGSFTAADKQDLGNQGYMMPFHTMDRSVTIGGLGFWKECERRHLGVFPASGYIDYSDYRAYEVGDPIEDVPDQATTQELGLKFFDQFGFPRSDLARKPNSSELLTYKVTDTRGSRASGVPPVVLSRGVMFVRRIDGVNFAGIGVAGGFQARFVSHAKVAQLELVWRNLKPYKKYQVASPSQIVDWIKTGKAVVTFPDVDKVNARPLKGLTITDVSPLYMGELGRTPQDLTLPFADLTVLADTGQTNIAIDLYCPILSENAVAP